MSYQMWNSLYSKTLEMNTSLVMVTPRGDRPAHNSPPRLLVLLHGLTGNYLQWGMRVDMQAMADQFNLAVAMPDGQRSFWLDQAYGLPWGRWVGKELPARLDQMLRLSPAKPIIGGLSMGGYGAVRAAFDYPDTFASAFSLSGTLNVAEPAFRGRHPDLYQIGFGNPDAPRPQDDLVGRLQGEGEQLPPIFAVCGESDRLLQQNRTFVKTLEEAGGSVDYREAPGEHNFRFWNKWLPAALQWAAA